MASPVNPPRGMRDFLPAEKARRERVLAVIRATYRAHGFDEIETPVMEDASRLHSGLGGDNEKLAFGVLKRGLTADAVRAAAEEPSSLADLGLRFDLTVPLARFYASHRAELPTVFRAIQLAPVWRAERPQKGRYRQFVQCDIDVIGDPSPLAEVELLTASAATLRALGLRDWTIRINDRRLLTSMLTAFGFPVDDHAGVLITVDKLDKIGIDGVIGELRERGAAEASVTALAAHLDSAAELKGGVTEPELLAALPAGVDRAAVRELAELAAAVTATDAAVPLSFDPYLVRGMGYYTGPIFEVQHPELGYSLGGGGRYDGMIGRFLGSDVPATGFSLGFERIVDLVELGEEQGEDAIALVHDDVPPARLAVLKSALLATGARVRLERRARNTKAQLAGLAALGYRRFAFVSDATASVDDLDVRTLD